ncbi:MAG: TlpA family protein disulfide reductase [Planctomycetaceae bacterium]|nr:TlpA family protein disulfide reductase [Planctomycetaceae bacterium]
MQTKINRPIARLVLLTSVGLAAAAVSFRPDAAQGVEPASKSATFRGLLEQRQRETIRAVSDYIANNPQADDVDQASAWIFETAAAIGLEADAVPLAETLLARRDLDPSSRQLAQTTLCLGLARSGKFDAAFAEFGAYLQGARFQSPFKSLDLASSLAAQARVAGNLAASKDIYERLASAYALNAQIGEIVEGRIARQELIGKPAPAVATTDTLGKPFELAGHSGQVVLVDFWATSCAPCLAEFPNLKQLYQEYHPKGFEIVGVSFDDSADTVEAYRTRAKLTWPMVMNESPQGRISDRFRTQTIPALFVIDQQGQVAQVDVRGADLRLVIEKLLAAK